MAAVSVKRSKRPIQQLTDASQVTISETIAGRISAPVSFLKFIRHAFYILRNRGDLLGKLKGVKEMKEKKREISTLRRTFGIILYLLSLIGAGTHYYHHRNTILAAKDKKCIVGKKTLLSDLGKIFFRNDHLTSRYYVQIYPQLFQI